MDTPKYSLIEYISEAQIKAAVEELGKKISEDYAGKSIVMVSVLKGSVVFLADLMRAVSVPVEVAFISLSSYGDGSKTSGVVRLLQDVGQSLQDKDVLIVEDIVDSGHTIDFLLKTFGVRGANSLKVCTLLDKPSCRQVEVLVDYCGFQMEDKFVVGYGLDYAGRYRNLRELLVVEMVGGAK